MKLKWLSLLPGAVALLISTNVEAAPIYTNLADSVVQPYQPGLLVIFESVEPFRFGGFIGLNGDPPHATVDNFFDLGPLIFDGKYYRVSVILPTIQCGVVQVDADSHDFPGLGRLFTTNVNCGGGGGSNPQDFTPQTPDTPQNPPDGPPTTPSSGTPVPEPTIVLLGLTALAARFLR